MDNKRESRAKWIFWVSVGCVCILFYVFLTRINGFMEGFRTLGYFVYPVFLGLVIAYCLSPLVHFFQTKVFGWVKKPSVNRNLSVLVSFLLIILLLLMMLVGLVPQLVNSTMNLIQNMDTYTKQLQSGLENLEAFAAGYKIDISESVESASNLVQNLTGLVGSNMEAIVSTSFDVGKALLNYLIAFVLAIYLLCDKFPFQQSSHRFLRAVIRPGIYDQTVQFLSQCNEIMTRYIISELVDAFIVGAANALFMSIMHMPYMALISILVGVTNLAPTFGPIVGGAIGAFILVLVNPWDALGFLIFTLCLQTVDGYLIKPKLFGDMLGVSSVWILASIIIGGRVLGILGILIAIPIAAIIALLYLEYVLPELERRRQKLDAAEAAETAKETKAAEEAKEERQAEA